MIEENRIEIILQYCNVNLLFVPGERYKYTKREVFSFEKFVFTAVAGLGLFIGGTVASAEEQTHVVAPGDTLSGLATEYGTTVDDLLALNESIQDPNLIFDGETLLIFSDAQPMTRAQETTENSASAN